MSGGDDFKYFKLRKEAKTYISRVFTYSANDLVEKRNIVMVMDGSDEAHIGEIEGAMCLRVTGNKIKTQVAAVVTQDDKAIRRLTLQTFKPRAAGHIDALEEHSFTFRDDEFLRLQNFIEQIQFLDLSNKERFPVEDISRTDGPKYIIDAHDKSIFDSIRNLSKKDREDFLNNLHKDLSPEDINLLLGRRSGLTEFIAHAESSTWCEKQWQDFFEREQWVFGYGLDYRILKPFDREMTVGGRAID